MNIMPPAIAAIVLCVLLVAPAARPTPVRATQGQLPSLMARQDASATPLADGRVLVAGGFCSCGGDSRVLDSAALYDARTDRWRPTGPLGTPRGGQTATLLPAGQVLVAGGYDATLVALAGAELDDPRAGRWRPTGRLHTALS